jgi:excisionase family DNA binding protein
VNDRLLKAREVAELLGLSSATVLDWFESGRLPGFKLSSRAVRFRESEILGWLEERRFGHVAPPFDTLSASRTRAMIGPRCRGSAPITKHRPGENGGYNDERRR